MGFTIIILLGVLLLAGALLGFNSSYIPGPLDDQTKLESAVTKTANFDGAALDLGADAAGGPGQAFGAVVNIAAADRTTADETYTFTLQESSDNAAWNDATPGVTRTAIGAFALHGFVSKRFVRLKLVVGGTTPSVTYTAHLVPHQ
jgi:hypothetical protein